MIVSNGKEWKTTCPSCGKPDHYYICVDGKKKGIGYCHKCHYTQYHDEWWDKNYPSFIQTVEYVMWDFERETKPRYAPPKYWSPEAAALWKKRCPTVDPEEWGVTECKSGALKGRLVFPAHDKMNRLFRVGKAIDPLLKPPYLNNGPVGNTLFGFDRVRTSHVTVVEGVFDAISIGTSVVALLGQGNKNQFQRLACQFKKVFVMLDADAWERTQEVVEILRGYMCEAVPVKCMAKDPDEMMKILGGDLW